MEKIDLKKLMEADDEPEGDIFDEPTDEGDFGEGGDFGGDFGGDDSFGFGDDESFDEELDYDEELAAADSEEPEEDIIDRIKKFINSKSSYVNNDGEIVNNDVDVAELEASDDINDNIEGFLTKITDPDSDLLQYVDFDKDSETYNVNADSFFRKKAKQYTNLNSQEKLDRIQDDLYYLVNKFKKVYDKNINMTHIPNELFTSLKNKFGEMFNDVYNDIELNKYDNYLDSMNNKDNEESSEPNPDKSEEEFVWENIMKHKFEKIELPVRLDEDNYYAKSKGELLEFGFIEKEGWYVFVGQFLKLAVNIDFDVVVTSNFDKLTDSEFEVNEKTFTNNIADGIIFSSGLKGHVSDLMNEIDIMQKTFDIADKVKAKLFG